MYAGEIEYLNVYTPSGRGVKGSPNSVNPKEVELKILKSLGTKGSVTFPKPGTLISIVGAEGEGTSYVDASTTPNVKVLYVGTTNISRFNAGILIKIKIPEDLRMNPLYPLVSGLLNTF